MKIKGIVKYRDIGVGVWTLLTDEGIVYELYQPPQDIRKDGLKIEGEGKIKEDIMTIAMIGQILELENFTKAE